jgi:hypothetical protein
MSLSLNQKKTKTAAAYEKARAMNHKVATPRRRGDLQPLCTWPSNIQFQDGQKAQNHSLIIFRNLDCAGFKNFLIF